jgi:pSer/pThr/pTyr-binding forkhead associated (FHA) protein
MATVILRVKNGSLAGQPFVFHGADDCTVGRADDCQLRLPMNREHVSISRHHCSLRIRPPRVWVHDLRSRNGTRINGMQIGHPAAWPSVDGNDMTPLPAYELHDGDELELAGLVFEVAINRTGDHAAHRPEEEKRLERAEAATGSDVDAVSSPGAMSL